MGDTPSAHRFYGELAAWWPLISPPEDYEEEAAFAAALLASASIPVHEVLELGSGGGNNACHLKASFTMTLVDLSVEMLDVSRRLNPDCEHRHGDMRSVRLGRSFDAVFVRRSPPPRGAAGPPPGRPGPRRRRRGPAGSPPDTSARPPAPRRR